MDVYVGLVIIIVFTNLIFNSSEKSTKNMYINIVSLALFIVMGLRNVYYIGNDSATSYYILFTDLGRVGYKFVLFEQKENFNRGFDLIMKIGRDLTFANYQLFMAIFSAFIIFSFRFLIKKYSTSPIQSTCYFIGLLYYTFMFSAEKQALAMAILVFAFDAAVEKRPLKFLCFVLISATIHYPALIFLPSYFIMQIELSKGHLFILTILLTVTYLYRNEILNIMMSAYGSEVEADAMNNIVFFKNKVIIMIIILITALLIKPAYGQNRIYKALLLFTCIAITFQTYSGYNNIFERLADYYFYYSILFIPMIFHFPKEGKHRFTERSEEMLGRFIPVVFCAFLIFRFVSYVHSGADSLFPYYFFFQ